MAQLDKASDYESEDWGFKSLQGYLLLFLESEKIKPVEESYAQAGPFHAWMPEWSKGADLRSAGQFVRLGSNPSPGSIWGISSIGRVRALQARGTGIETPMLQALFFFPVPFRAKKVRSSEGSGRSARLGWPSGLRRSTQVRVSSEAWVRIPFQAVHFLLFGGDAGACRLATPVSAGRWSSGMILL